MFFAINPKISNAKVNGRCEKVNKDGLLNEDHKNYMQIVCRRCGSIFFPDDVVEYIENHPVDLRVMTHQGAGPLETERISWWWHTTDDMAFDTIGWQTIDKKKVLMCGDCELGPVGWRSEDNSKFYVAVERCSYKKVESSEDEDEEEEDPKKAPVKSSPAKNGAPQKTTTTTQQAKVSPAAKPALKQPLTKSPLAMKVNKK